jgi:hypothetical protein
MFSGIARLAFRGMTGTAGCDHAGLSCPPRRGEFQGRPKWPSETTELLRECRDGYRIAA